MTTEAHFQLLWALNTNLEWDSSNWDSFISVFSGSSASPAATLPAWANEEKNRFEKYKFEKDRKLSLGGALLIRTCICAFNDHFYLNLQTNDIGTQTGGKIDEKKASIWSDIRIA